MEKYLPDNNIVESSRILFLASEFAKANLLYLQESGELKALQPHTSKREKMKSYLIFLVMDGSGKVTYEDNTLIVSKGACLFLNCDKPYSHSTDSKQLWCLKWIHFYGSIADSIYEKYLKQGGKACFYPQQFYHYVLLMEQIHSIANHQGNNLDMEINQALAALLCRIMSESISEEATAVNSAAKKKLENVQNYIEQNYAQQITLDDLQRLFFINKFYLTRIFKEKYGLSINTYLTNMRITNAKYLIRFTDKPIEEIGLLCGIPDSSYFNKIFRKVEGISPSRYRRMWR